MESPETWTRLTASLAVAAVEDVPRCWSFLVSQGLVEDSEANRRTFRKAVREELERGEITGPSLPCRVALTLSEAGIGSPEADSPDPWGKASDAAFKAFEAPPAFEVPEGPVDTDGVMLLEKRFVWAFLPAVAATAHGLLYDFKDKYDYAPTPEALDACLRAYLELLQVARRDNPVTPRGILNASELALAYVARAVDAKIPLSGVSCRDALIEAAGQVVEEAKPFFPKPLILDGYKRIDAIASALQRF